MIRRPTPSGMNTMPIAKNTGNTLDAVIIGCHAGNLCCLKAVSVQHIHYLNNKNFNIAKHRMR